MNMKKSIKLILMILVSSSACSQDLSNIIAGRWLYKGINNRNLAIECPDVLIFGADGSYSVLNECYGEGIKIPLVEKGRWHFDSNQDKILLTDRKFFTNYVFHDSISLLVIHLKEVTDKAMKICFADMSNCIPEIYEKVPDFSQVQEYTGNGTTTKELQLTGSPVLLKLSFEFYKEPDQLVIENQSGKELFKTLMTSTDEIKNTTISLSGETRLIFKIKSGRPNSMWRFKVEIE